MDFVGFRPQDLKKTVSGEYSLLTVFFLLAENCLKRVWIKNFNGVCFITNNSLSFQTF